jgi:hypothetical protein
MGSSRVRHGMDPSHVRRGDARKRGISARATEDSNPWSSAPEGDVQPNELALLDGVWGGSREVWEAARIADLCRRALEAVEARDQFAGGRLIEACSEAQRFAERIAESAKTDGESLPLKREPEPPERGAPASKRA